MRQPMCSRCKKRPALFIYRMKGNEMYCTQCVMDMEKGPFQSMLQNMGRCVSDEEMELAGEQLDVLLRSNGGEKGLKELLQVMLPGEQLDVLLRSNDGEKGLQELLQKMLQGS